MTEQLHNQELVACAVTHLEIPVLKTLQEETARFYAAVFGWSITFDMMPNYGMTTNTEGKVSIGLPLVEEIPAMTSIYIHVDDIDTTLTTIKNLGGEVVSEKNMISEDIGFGATFRDLSGNQIGLFSPE